MRGRGNWKLKLGFPGSLYPDWYQKQGEKLVINYKARGGSWLPVQAYIPFPTSYFMQYSWFQRALGLQKEPISAERCHFCRKTLFGFFLYFGRKEYLWKALFLLSAEWQNSSFGRPLITITFLLSFRVQANNWIWGSSLSSSFSSQLQLPYLLQTC